MPASALALALAAAVLHATWNLLIVRARDTQAATGVALIASVVLFLPVAVIVWDVQRQAIPYIVVSGLLELTYIALLAAAYERVPLSIVYPVARGTAPVLVLIGGALLLGIHPSGGQVLGILVVAAGVMIVRGLGRGVDPAQLILPLAVAVTIASYTLVDRSGIHYSGAIPYFEMTALITLAYPAWIARRRGTHVLRAELKPAAVVAGGAMFAAYCLVLAALRLAPPGPVAAVRESSVVIATALAAGLLGEEVSRVRLLGAVLVAGGVALLALS
jgi:drug/metabolite transporter (DMT)-like permease